MFAQDIRVDPTGANDGTLDKSVRFGKAPAALPPTAKECERIFVHPPRPPGLPTTSFALGVLSAVGIGSKRTDCGNQYGLDLYTGNTARLSITRSGQVGIGTAAPEYALTVRGDGDVQLGLWSNDEGGRKWTIQSSGKDVPGLAGTFQIVDRDANLERLLIDSSGMVSVRTLQITGGSDLAEPFDAESKIAEGSVVVIDEVAAGRLKLSTRAYDRHVAGVASGANGINPGVVLAQPNPRDQSTRVALSGRVYVLAEALKAAIQPGDLLTSSNLPGHAMKATNLGKAQGAILGKAMSSLSSGTGMVLMLVSLQ